MNEILQRIIDHQPQWVREQLEVIPCYGRLTIGLKVEKDFKLYHRKTLRAVIHSDETADISISPGEQMPHESKPHLESSYTDHLVGDLNIEIPEGIEITQY